MNNTCSACGAIYNVALKDVGRRIKCKKCGTALIVTEAGLELDQLVATPAAANELVDESDAPARRSRSRKSGPSIDFIKIFKDFGGLPTVFFAFGAFLVIFFLFQPIIGNAAVERARGRSEQIDLRWKTEERALRKEKKSDEEISTAREKFYKTNDKDKAEENVGFESVDNKRAKWMELYGMMFGFLFLMVGSLGYMNPEQSLVRRILGTVVVGAQMLIVFLVFASGGCKGNPIG